MALVYPLGRIATVLTTCVTVVPSVKWKPYLGEGDDNDVDDDDDDDGSDDENLTKYSSHIFLMR